MDAYSLHLAMAALVGASFVAVSAYYMHRKTLNQLLEFAKAIERDREDVEAAEGGDDAEENLNKYPSRRRRKGNAGYYNRGSASSSDVTLYSGGGEEKRNGQVHVDFIPAGLPRLHTLTEGTPVYEFPVELLIVARNAYIVLSFQSLE